MALNKTIQAPNGVSLAYWRLLIIDVNYTNSIVRLLVGGYIDRTNRDAFAPTMTKTLVVKEGDFTTYFDHTILNTAGNNPMKAAYEWMKTQTDFDGATDIIEIEEFA